MQHHFLQAASDIELWMVLAKLSIISLTLNIAGQLYHIQLTFIANGANASTTMTIPTCT